MKIDVPSNSTLFKVNYEGEAYVVAKSAEEAIEKYKTSAIQTFEKVVGTDIATKGDEYEFD